MITKLKALGSPASILQRVSPHTVVIRSEESSCQNLLKLLHVRIDAQGKIHCQCTDYKSASTLSSVHTSIRLSKRCIHTYAIFWALLSDVKMKKDFAVKLRQEVAGKCGVNINFRNFLIIIDASAKRDESCTKAPRASTGKLKLSQSHFEMDNNVYFSFNLQ